jgi:uncharacterized membrane protein
MMQRSFSIEHAIGVGWNTFKAHWALLIGLAVAVLIIGNVPQGLGNAAQGGGQPGGFQFLMGLLSVALQAVLTLGVTYIALRLVSGQSAEFGDLFARVSLVLNYLIAGFLLGIIVAVGLLLLIVPGLIFAAKLSFFPYFVVDDGAGPIHALQRSWSLTNGVTFKVLVFGLVLLLINFVGLLALGLGLLVTYPVSYLAHAHVYRELREQAELGVQAGLPVPALG